MIAEHKAVRFQKAALTSWHTSKHQGQHARQNNTVSTGYTQLQKQPAKPLIPAETIPERITVRLATSRDAVFAAMITDEMRESALVRGCGISRRSPAGIEAKMTEGKAIIAVTSKGKWAGFSYLETYENNQFVSNSGLIVAPSYRNCGVAAAIKQQVFELSRKLYPKAKIFSITTGGAVMKMNSRLGFEPVTYSEITREERFWQGCKSCVNYQILAGKGYKNCFCTAMLFVPEEIDEEIETETEHYK